jgi:hypothetical protein
VPVSVRASSAAFGEPGRRTEKRPRGELLALTGVLVGALGFAAALTCVYMAMRNLMVQAGGMCASGGPYQIAAGHECSSGQIGLLMGGIFAMLIFGGIYATATGAAGGLGGASDAAYLMWAALFGSLGFNFLSLGFNPPHGQSGAGGWIISGVVFELMALGGLLAFLSSARDWLRRGGGPEPSLIPGPVVRAAVNEGAAPPSPPSGRAPRVGGPQGEPGPSAPVPKRLNLPPHDPGGR